MVQYFGPTRVQTKVFFSLSTGFVNATILDHLEVPINAFSLTFSQIANHEKIQGYFMVLVFQKLRVSY